MHDNTQAILQAIDNHLEHDHGKKCGPEQSLRKKV